MANMVMAVGLPAVQAWLQRVPPPPLATVSEVAWAALPGRWYELAHLVRGDAQSPDSDPAGDGGPAEIHVRLREDGRIDFDTLRGADSGSSETERAVAEPRPESAAQLRVSSWPTWLQWLPLAWHDEWVMHLDADVWLLGSPQRDVLRLLCRQERLAGARFEALLDLAHAQGFPVERLRVASR
ncbi:MAG: lipocalin family protein [Chitinophagaceae bacterium]|nr:lipocalin family protein [Rubrivivax sp.]